jgi:site-specific recombinase XerD
MRSRSKPGGWTPKETGPSKVWVLTPDRFLRPEEVATLRASIAAERRQGTPKKIRDAAIVELLLGSGLRVSEACSLAIRDLHLQGDEPAIFVRKGKGGQPRLVPISSRLASSLGWFLDRRREWDEPLDSDRPLFLGQHGVALTRFGMTKMWKAALRAAGLPDRWGIHAARHTFAVEVYRQTRDLRLTQRLLGHASVVTTTTYASLLDEDVRAGVEKIWA